MTLHLRLDSGVALPGQSALQIAASVFLPAGAPRHVFVCLPGGDMTRRYFDLHVPIEAGDDDDSFSFAQQMTARGFGVVTLDHLGVGDSDRAQDIYALSTEVVARANAQATEQLLERLRAGTLAPGIAALPGLESIGLGHSMGALLTLVQQATLRMHAALALLGFSTRGMPDNITPEMRAAAHDPAQVRAHIVEWARMFFLGAHSAAKSKAVKVLFKNSAADPRGLQALKSARTPPLLPLPSIHSMLPGNVAPEAAQITVPVFLGLGEHDIAGPPHEIPAAFPRTRDLTLYVLPEASHSLFPFPSRRGLFDRLAAWARALPASDTVHGHIFEDAS